MASCYTGVPGDGRKGAELLPYIPLPTSLTDGTQVLVDFFSPQDAQGVCMEMMNDVIREGISWPFDEEFKSADAFAGYFLSHCALLVRDKDSSAVMGCFYVKPNFPGRSSHFCNGGFITHKNYRNRGVGVVMGQTFLRVAKDLGYRAAYFNLCYENNPVSIRLWRKLGFTALAVIPKVAAVYSKGTDRDEPSVSYVDATQFHIDLTTFDHSTATMKSGLRLWCEDVWSGFAKSAPYLLVAAAGIAGTAALVNHRKRGEQARTLQ